tara:strand:+ start:83 stop:286 length:204 start_codon:yes stop_codon:yes gene_type:complete
MTIIYNKFELKQIVYLCTDIEQRPRIVTGFMYRGSYLVYELASGMDSSAHYESEISEDKDILITTTN